MFRPICCSLYLLCSQEKKRKTHSSFFFFIATPPFLENHADVNVFIKPSTVCLNGIEMDPWWGTTVTAGKATFGSIMWFGGDLEYNGITAVETITMTMSIFDEFGEETFVAEELVINP